MGEERSQLYNLTDLLREFRTSVGNKTFLILLPLTYVALSYGVCIGHVSFKDGFMVFSVLIMFTFKF